MNKLITLALCATLAACAGTDNAPQPTELLPITNKLALSQAWEARTSSAELYRFAPDVVGDEVYVAGVDGLVGFKLSDGRKLLEARSSKPLAGGLGAAEDLLVAGTLKGDVLAYGKAGQLKWQVKVSSEVVAPPQIAEGVVVVRTVDGHVSGLNAQDGKQLWSFQRNLGSLVLRSYAPATIADGAVFIGLPGGRLAALGLKDGRMLWESPVANPKGSTELERLSDVSSTPVVSRGEVCAVAFQGRVACFATSNGTLLWARDISSYVGLAIDAERVYVSDEVGQIQAFERSNGRHLWKQTALYGRHPSTPAVINGQVVVGDFEGYVHLLDGADGSLAARTRADKSAIRVAPVVADSRLLVQTEQGGLFAFNVQTASNVEKK